MKISSVIIAVLVLVVAGASNVRAVGNLNAGQQGEQGNSTTSPVQNQNQVQTQNQGEETQLWVQTQQEQGNRVGQDGNGNKLNLNESMGSLAQKVQELLSTQDAAGGIGEQVREWARLQNQSQINIQTHVAKIEAKAGLAKTLFGPDFGSINKLKQEVQQNRVRVQQLEQLKLKLANDDDSANIDEIIALMQHENIVLQEKINLEEQNSGIFGWFVKLFVR